MPSTKILITLDDDVVATLDAICAEESRPRSYMFTHMIRQWHTLTTKANQINLVDPTPQAAKPEPKPVKWWNTLPSISTEQMELMHREVFMTMNNIPIPPEHLAEVAATMDRHAKIDEAQMDAYQAMVDKMDAEYGVPPAVQRERAMRRPQYVTGEYVDQLPKPKPPMKTGAEREAELDRLQAKYGHDREAMQLMGITEDNIEECLANKP